MTNDQIGFLSGRRPLNNQLPIWVYSHTWFFFLSIILDVNDLTVLTSPKGNVRPAEGKSFFFLEASVERGNNESSGLTSIPTQPANLLAGELKRFTYSDASQSGWPASFVDGLALCNKITTSVL